MSKKPTEDDLLRETNAHKDNNYRYTYGDYLTWDDDTRYELIDGIVYIMSPAPGRTHQKILGNLFMQFANYLEGKECEVYFAPFDVRLPDGDEADKEVSTVVQPDLTVFCDHEKLDDRGGRRAPDLAVEILSPGSKKRDRIIKKKVYEKHGVREYWIVDSMKKLVEVYLLDDKFRYGKPSIYREESILTVNIFKDLIVDLKTIFVDD